MNTLLKFTDSPPYQYNYGNRGKTIYWNGTDQPELYEKNVRDPISRRILDESGWLNATIEYSYNSHGFRCDEFDARPNAIALGCSFTEGTAIHLHQTWPTYLSELLNLHVWNLGSGGASIDTVFRILDYYIDKLNPKFVFILIPPESRFEYCDINGGFPIIQPFSLKHLHPEFAKEWLTQPFNGTYNTRKTMLAIQQICKNFNIPVISHSCDDAANGDYNTTGQYDLARDLQHRGFIYQQHVANIMHCEFNTLNGIQQ
jgi:hypothetical protein